MLTTTAPRVIENIIDEIKSKKILTNHPIQRKPGQFSSMQKSLLIDSALRNYPIPPIYLFMEKKKNYIIDGLQRMTIFQSFKNDEFKLSKKLKPVSYEEVLPSGSTKLVEAKIGGKTYSDLPDELKKEFDKRELTVITISDCTKGELNEVFLRLNNGVPLNSNQKLHVCMEEETQKAIKEVASLPFFTTTVDISEKQKTRSLDTRVIAEVLMLNHGITNLNKASMEKFFSTYKYSANDFDAIKNAANDLILKFPDKVQHLSKVNIAPIVSAYMTASSTHEQGLFLSQLDDFFDNYDNQDDYKDLIQSGTSASSNVQARLDFFKKLSNFEDV